MSAPTYSELKGEAMQMTGEQWNRWTPIQRSSFAMLKGLSMRLFFLNHKSWMELPNYLQQEVYTAFAEEA